MPKKHPKPTTPGVVYCTTCHGTNVQHAAWVSPNRGDEVGEPFGTWNAGDNTYCEDCDDNTDLATVEAPRGDSKSG